MLEIRYQEYRHAPLTDCARSLVRMPTTLSDTLQQALASGRHSPCSRDLLTIDSRRDWTAVRRILDVWAAHIES